MMNNETRMRIMDVAFKLFSEKGYHPTTTKQIAEGAGVNEVTIFRHFGSKSNLFHEITEYYLLDSQVGIVLEDIEHLDFKESMELIAIRIYKMCIRNTRLYKIQLKITDDEKGIVKLKLSRELISLLEKHFTHLKKQEKINGNPEMMAVTLINSILGAFTVELLGDGTVTEIPWEELVREHARQFSGLYDVNRDVQNDIQAYQSAIE